jgi:hypothetical protein
VLFLLAEPPRRKEWNDTHVGAVLPERAPSEGPRSTAAVGPTWVPLQRKEVTSELGGIISDLKKRLLVHFPYSLSGRKRWTLRREKTPDPFDFSWRHFPRIEEWREY